MVGRALRFVIVGSMALALFGCPTGKQYSIGGGPTVSLSQSASDEDETGPGSESAARQPRSGGGIEVLLVSYDKALEIAHRAAMSDFPTAGIKKENDSVTIRQSNFLMGNAFVRIKPKLVMNLGPEGGHGFTYETQAFTFGGNPSAIPGYLSSEFFAALAKFRNDQRVQSTHFRTYKFSQERGVTEVMPAGVPVTYAEFARYLDKKRKLARFEGIWSDHGGRNVLGIVPDKSDPLYNYKAFVISSKESNWQPGEIKIKFIRLRAGRASISEFWASDKRQSGVTWSVGDETMVSVNTVEEPFRRVRIALVKTYPGKRKGETVGVGTGWAVTEDGVFATNHHVIDDAGSIWVGFREGNPKKARVIAVDKKTDLALIKIENPDRSYRPLPLSTGLAANGSPVTVIGYPLAFELGDDARVTDGVISAQSGFDRDITHYQISAAIQGGNSGGPVLNDRAEVVGVVVSKINKVDVENVNFAIKVPYLKLLMESAGIEYARGRSDGTRTPKELFEIFGDSVLPVWTKN